MNQESASCVYQNCVSPCPAPVTHVTILSELDNVRHPFTFIGKSRSWLILTEDVNIQHEKSTYCPVHTKRLLHISGASAVHMNGNKYLVHSPYALSQTR